MLGLSSQSLRGIGVVDDERRGVDHPNQIARGFLVPQEGASMEPISLKAVELLDLHDAELRLVCMDRDSAILRLGFKGVDGMISEFSFEKAAYVSN